MMTQAEISKPQKTMPKSYLSPEDREGLSQNAVYAAESQGAVFAGDEETAWEWLKMAKLPAHSLMFLKRRHGAEWIRNMGFDTSKADKTYGKGWLDKQT